MDAVQPNSVTPEAMLARIAAGDASAMRDFYARFETTVLRYCTFKLNDPAAAADVLNEVMLEVWRGAAWFQGRSQVSTWLLGIAHHKLTDHLRRERRFQHDDLDPVTVDEQVPVPAETVAAAQDRQRLERCLARLPQHQRETVYFAFYQDLSYPEIAAIMDCPEGTVKTRVLHAKQALKRCLAERG